MRGKQRQPMGIGIVVQEERKRRKLSLGGAAEAWRLTKGALSRIEAGDRTNLPLNTLVKLCRGMEISVDELLQRADGTT